jgi:hypothetical protein
MHVARLIWSRIWRHASEAVKLLRYCLGALAHPASGVAPVMSTGIPKAAHSTLRQCPDLASTYRREARLHGSLSVPLTLPLVFWSAPEVSALDLVSALGGEIVARLSGLSCNPPASAHCSGRVSDRSGFYQVIPPNIRLGALLIATGARGSEEGTHPASGVTPVRRCCLTLP